MNIISNGSKFAGQPLDTVEQLLDLLYQEPLDPRFEWYGGFITNEGGQLMAHGNFYNISHVFDIRGSLEEMSPIVEAIIDNLNSQGYKEIKRELLSTTLASRTRHYKEKSK